MAEKRIGHNHLSQGLCNLLKILSLGIKVLQINQNYLRLLN